MKTPKYYLYLREDEYRLLFHTLVEFKNKLHREGRYTDSIDELLIKISKAKRKRIRIAQKQEADTVESIDLLFSIILLVLYY